MSPQHEVNLNDWNPRMGQPPVLQPPQAPTTAAERPARSPNPTPAVKGPQASSEPPRTLNELRAVEPEEHEVFTHNAALERLWNIAVEKSVSPWGVLGVALAYTAAATEPTLRLPPLVGGEASLNLLVGLVGESGAGKGASMSVVKDSMTFAAGGFTIGGLEERPLGSGQGLAEVFKPPVGASEDETPPPPVTRALFEATEIDGLAATTKQRGSNLMSVLRKVYSGENPGNMNASKETTRNVPGHSYRAVLVCGIQPKRSLPLLTDEEADGGTPQRWLWFDTRPYPISQRRADKNLLGQFHVALPTAAGNQAVEHVGVPEVARDTTKKLRTDYLEGTTPAGSLQGHQNLTRLKVMALLALMDGRDQATERDWDIAGLVIDRSEMNMRRCQQALNEAVAKRAERKAEEQGHYAEAKEQEMLKRARQAVLNWLKRKFKEDKANGVSNPGWRRDTGRGGLLQGMRGTMKDGAAEVLPTLVDEGAVLHETTTNDGVHHDWFRIVI